MRHSSGLGARPISDEENIKPFLERLNPSEDTMICPSGTFQAICKYHQANQPFDASQVPVPVTEIISMSSGAVNGTLFGSSNVCEERASSKTSGKTSRIKCCSALEVYLPMVFSRRAERRDVPLIATYF